MEILPQLALIALLVLLNGFFVASEFAIVTVRKTRIEELVKKGSKPAKLVQKAIDNLDEYISAIQLGVTLSSLGLGWIGDSAISGLISPYLSIFLPETVASISSHTIGLGISFIFITFILIILGELVPKTIAYQKAEKTALLIAGPLTIFYTIFKPFVLLLNYGSVITLKIIGFKTSKRDDFVHSEEEIKIILAQSAEKGAIEKEEAEMVLSVLKLGDTPVGKIMIPKSRIVAFDKNESLRRVIKVSQKNPHSRFPIYDDSIDKIVGFIHIKDIYRNLLTQTKIEAVRNLYWHFLTKGKDKKITQMGIIRDIPKISENKKIDDVLILMREKRVHVAVVKNEENKTAGIVTLEDVVENLVGDINDEFDMPENAKSKTEKVKKITSFIKRKV